MTAETDPVRGPSQQPMGRPVVSAGRRQLLRAGLGSAPVLMTLTSMPAGAGVCTTASAFTSVTPSGRAGPAPVTCSGNSPTTWNSTSTWPVNKNSTRFNDILSPGLPTPSPKLTDLFALTSPSTFQSLQQHCAAAYLNQRAGLIPSQILISFPAGVGQTLWAACSPGGGLGTYSPTAGVVWQAGEVIAWLKTLYT